MTDRIEDKAQLVGNLLFPSSFNHEVERIELVETHISWIVLTGIYAYKIKKPVNLGFLDFSTLEKRQYYCTEELRLNRRTAREIYLDVVPIKGSIQSPVVDGTGQTLEWALKMLQFDNKYQLDILLEQDSITAQQLDLLSDAITSFHERAGRLDLAENFGSAEQVYGPVMDNYNHLRKTAPDGISREAINRIKQWHEDEFGRLSTEFEQRRLAGFVRECHGDLHARNITFFHERPVLFDCIEFDPALRWIDTINDLAFLVMDCWERGHEEAAFHILNRYLENNGDYRSIMSLPFYLVYRAMVRAKVASIAHDQAVSAGDMEHVRRLSREMLRYIRFSTQLTDPATTPKLIITHGLSGSGKTVITRELIARLPALRIRSDVERKRKFGNRRNHDEAQNIDQGLYSPSISTATYEYLASMAGIILTAGFNVVIDAAFLQRKQRDMFKDVAARHSAEFVILSFHAPLSLLEQWITKRQAEKRDASDAGLAVLHHQIESREPLDKNEAAMTCFVDTSQAVDIAGLVSELETLPAR